MSSSAHWIGPRDALTAGRILGECFPGRGARLRATIRVLTAPHLISNGATAVVGIRPRASWARACGAIAYLLKPTPNAFDTHALPAALRLLPRNWQVVDLAASPVRREPHGALALAQCVLALADAHGARLNASARTDDPRLVPAYLAHGFQFVHSPAHQQTSRRPSTVEMARPPQRAAPPPSILRTGRTSLRYLAHTFGASQASLGGRVLDLGAGDSPLVKEVAAAGAVGLALDLDYRYHSPSRGPYADQAFVVAADAAHLPFPDNTFDTVIAVFVLQHLGDPQAALVEAVRVCRPEGQLLCHPLWSRRRAHALVGLPGVDVVPGHRFRRRRRPAVIIRSDLVSHWPGTAWADLAEALRPPPWVRTLGTIATRLTVAIRGTHRLHLRGTQAVRSIYP